MTMHAPHLPFFLDPLIAEAKQRMRRRRFLVVAAAIALVAAVAGVVLALRGPAVTATRKHRSPIRVTLTAQNHQPRPSPSPYKHWWYSVKVTTATGRSVASTIHLQILSGHRPLAGVGLVMLKKGYDQWGADIGGEAGVLNALPRGKKLIFQAVVRADGVTVKRNWPIVVPLGPIYSVHEVKAAFAAEGIALKRERPARWPSNATALWARHKVFVEVLLHEPGVWGGPGPVSSQVSANTNYTARANIEAWWNPAAQTAVKHALTRLRAP